MSRNAVLKTVLILEDDRRLADLWRGALESTGLRVLIENTAEAGIARIAEGPVDVLVADLAPGDGGRDPAPQGGLLLLAYLGLNAHRAPRVLVVCGPEATPEKLQAASILGPDTALSKPVDPADLRQRVGQLLEAQGAERVALTQAEENRIRAHQAQLSMDAASHAVLWIGEEGRIRYANRAATEMLGRTAESLLQAPVWEFLPELQPKAWSEEWLGLRERSMRGRDTVCRAAGGSSLEVSLACDPFEFDGEAVAILAVQDVSELRRAKTQLRSLGRILDESPAEIAIFRRSDLRFLYANRSALRNRGYTAVELHSLTPLDLMPTLTEQVLRRLLERVDTAGEELVAFDSHHVRADGTRYALEGHLQPALFQDQECFAIVGADVTERQWMQELQRANEDLAEYASIASHDLKSPLRAIHQLAAWTREDFGDELPEDVNRNLQRILVRTERMGNLLEGLLAYSKASHDSHRVETLSLPAVVAEAVDLAEVPPGFEIARQLEVQRCVAKRTPLVMILRNLVANAVKHHDGTEGRVQVSARLVGDADLEPEIELAVTDDGPGIPEKHRETVFGVFKRLSVQGEDDVNCSGLGLSLVRKYVDRAGGRVWIEAAEPRGTTVRFRLPSTGAEAVAPAGSASPTA